jgi:hypothetical protein
MAHATMTDELDRRLRTARPLAADVDPDAVDEDLLTRLEALPIDAPRRVTRTVAIPVAVGVTAAATAGVMLAGPGSVGGPSSASALTETLRWLRPPAGTVLHARSIETEGGQTTVHEFWQSADHPQQQRERIEGARTFELAGDAIYDPATNTIYTGPKSGGKGPATGTGPTADKRRAADVQRSADDAVKAKAIAEDHATAPGAPPVDPAKAAAKQAAAAAAGEPVKEPPAAGGVAPAKPSPKRGGDDGRIRFDPANLPAGDPIVTKVRVLLQAHKAVVVGREQHAGVATWQIALSPGVGEPTWRLWVDAATGRPVELRDPGRPGQQPQVIRWTTYEVLRPGRGAETALSLTAAHPGARIVADPDQWQAAEQRLLAQQ